MIDPTKPQLTILIVTMSRRDILERTLWHIYETSEDHEREIIIWDNGSIDDTPDFLATLKGWPGIRVVRSATNLGPMAPKRRMLAAVNTPFVFTFDDDCWMLNRGWATALVRVLDADPSIFQCAIGPAYHQTADFGISHTKLHRPFFRVIPYYPGPKAPTYDAFPPPDCDIAEVAGEKLVVPKPPAMQVPFAVSGTASGWRTDEARSCPRSDSISDLRQSWGSHLRRPGRRDATLIGYGMIHMTPAPLWYIGRYENYWEERAKRAPEWYKREADEQRKWLVDARAAIGWGGPIDDADITMPETP